MLARAAEKAPGRSAVLRRLFAACAPFAEQPALPAVFVYGPTGTGKTHTVNALLTVRHGHKAAAEWYTGKGRGDESGERGKKRHIERLLWHVLVHGGRERRSEGGANE